MSILTKETDWYFLRITNPKMTEKSVLVLIRGMSWETLVLGSAKDLTIKKIAVAIITPLTIGSYQP